MRTFSIIILATVAMALAACTSELPLDNRPCPCADGWKCCADQNVCVSEGDACPGEDTVSATQTDSETTAPRPDPEGLGDDCMAFGEGNGCEGKEADICLYSPVLAQGQCSIRCDDHENHSDCPLNWYCCDFNPVAGYTVCLPRELWKMASDATCEDKPDEPLDTTPCDPECADSMLGNGSCDEACNIKACLYDHGECLLDTDVETDTGEPLIPEGGQCSSLFGPLGKITGVCQQQDEACAGGFANPNFVPPLYPGKDPQFDCAEGLLCCIDTDQCEVMNAGMQSLVPHIMQEGSGTQCQPNGGCVEPAYEISENFACPDGETCCFTTLQ